MCSPLLWTASSQYALDHDHCVALVTGSSGRQSRQLPPLLEWYCDSRTAAWSSPFRLSLLAHVTHVSGTLPSPLLFHPLPHSSHAPTFMPHPTAPNLAHALWLQTTLAVIFGSSAALVIAVSLYIWRLSSTSGQLGIWRVLGRRSHSSSRGEHGRWLQLVVSELQDRILFLLGG
jgi:hypothetical protein